MKTGDIAALLVQGIQSQVSGTTDIGYHIGTVLSWDDITAANTIRINGNEFNNLRVITAGPAINIEEGDTVVVMRFQTQYFILGKVAAPGAGAAMRAVAGFEPGAVTASSTDWADLGGPYVSTYIGPSRKALILVSCTTNCGDNAAGCMSFAISGATNQDPNGFRGTWLNPAGDRVAVSTTQVVFLSQADGLNQGQTTFSARYYADNGSAIFDTRSITVFPF